MVYTFIIPEIEGCPLDQIADGRCSRTAYVGFQGEFVWGYQTYSYLKAAGMDVELAFKPKPESINLAHVNVLRNLGSDPLCYCVSLQADYPHYPLAQYHIVQNKEQVSENASYIPHWPLPNQISRDPDRSGVWKVAYQGARNFTDLDEDRLRRDLQVHGIAFEILDHHQWGDLHDVDVLIGIRHFGRKIFKRKPPTKLINAWLAGIPFIGGWDSAYSQIGIPGRHYLRVSSYRELLSAIVHLKRDQEFYQGLVRAGNEQGRHYTPEAIVARWRQLLETDVRASFDSFTTSPMNMIRHRGNVVGNTLKSAVKFNLRQLYRIPGVKRLRDRYYDPSR